MLVKGGTGLHHDDDDDKNQGNKNDNNTDNPGLHVSHCAMVCAVYLTLCWYICVHIFKFVSDTAWLFIVNLLVYLQPTILNNGTDQHWMHWYPKKGIAVHVFNTVPIDGVVSPAYLKAQWWWDWNWNDLRTIQVMLYLASTEQRPLVCMHKDSSKWMRYNSGTKIKQDKQN